jgi:hypothetical protein
MTEQVCKVTDPFCVEAVGAKWLGGEGTTATLSVNVRQLVTLTTGAAGDATLGYTPGTNTIGFYSVTATANQPSGTIPTAGSAYLTSVANSAATMRCVSAGARWWDIGPSTGVGGRVNMTEYPTFEAYRSDLKDSYDLNQGSKSSSFDRRKEGLWITTTSDENAYKFGPPVGSGTTAGFIDSRTCLFLGVTGPGNTPVLQVELVANYEFTFALNSIQSRMATKTVNPPNSGLITQAVTVIEANMETFFQGGVRAFGQLVRGHASRALQRLIDSAFGRGMPLLLGM